MKQMRRSLSLFLALIMIVSCFGGLSVFAADTESEELSPEEAPVTEQQEKEGQSEDSEIPTFEELALMSDEELQVLIDEVGIDALPLDLDGDSSDDCSGRTIPSLGHIWEYEPDPNDPSKHIKTCFFDKCGETRTEEHDHSSSNYCYCSKCSRLLFGVGYSYYAHANVTAAEGDGIATCTEAGFKISGHELDGDWRQYGYCADCDHIVCREYDRTTNTPLGDWTHDQDECGYLDDAEIYSTEALGHQWKNSWRALAESDWDNLTAAEKQQVGSKSSLSGWEIRYCCREIEALPDYHCKEHELKQVGYAVTFDANGGSWSGGATEKTVYTDKNGNLSGLPEDPAQNGMVFAGWYTTKAEGGTSVTASTKFTKAATVYARWTASTYTVTFKSNYKEATPAASEVQTIARGENTQLRANTFTEEHYTFLKWTVDEQGDGQSYTDAQSVKDIAEAGSNLDLYAQWTPKSYAVQLYPGIGTINSGNISSHTYGTADTLPTDISVTDATFIGWYDNSGFSGDPVTGIPANEDEVTQFWARYVMDPEIADEPAAKTLTFNGAAQELVTPGTGLNGTMMYAAVAKNAAAPAKSAYSDSIPTGVNAGEYDVYYYVHGEYKDTESAKVTSTIQKYELTAANIAVISNQYHTGSEIKPAPVVSATLKNGTVSLTSPADYTVVSYSNNTDVGTNASVKIQGQGNYTGTPSKTFAIVANPPRLKDDGAPTSNNYVYNTQAQALISAGVPEDGYTLQYSLDDKTWTDDIDEITGVDAGDYDVYYRTYVPGSTDPQDTSDSAKMIATIRKAVINSVTLSDVSFTYDNKLHTTSVSSVTTENSLTVPASEYTMTGTLKAKNAGIYTATATAKSNSTNYTGSANAQWVIGTGMIAYNATEYYSVPYSLDKDGNPVEHGIEVSVTFPETGAVVKYMDKDGNYTLDACPTYSDAGDYEIFFRITADNCETVTSSRSFQISKATPQVTLPTANNRDYNGKAENLLKNPGETTGGTLYYAVGKSMPTAANEWSATPPKATDAGTYTVWFKVVGNDNYSDVTVQSISVTVSKVKLTVTADSKTIDYGDDAPTYTAAITGFVNGETAATVLTGAAGLSCGYVKGDADNGKAGDYTITCGKGSLADPTNYTFDFVDGTLTVAPIDLDDDEKYEDVKIVFDPGDTYTYNGAVQKPGVSVTYKVKATGAVKTVAAADMTVVYDNAESTNVGQYGVSVTLSANYKLGNNNTLTKSYSIAAYELKASDIASISSQYHTGSEIKPQPVVTALLKAGSTVLKLGQDYTLSYGNNTDVGTNATVTVTGINNYTGTPSKTFAIVANPPQLKENGAPTSNNYVYNTQAQVLISAGQPKDGYTLQYSLDDETWTDDITEITGVDADEYDVYYRTVKTGSTDPQDTSDSAEMKAYIVKAVINAVSLSAYNFGYDESQHSVSVTAVTTENGLTVPASEYNVSGDLTGTAAQDYTVTATAKTDSKNYTGSANAQWNIGEAKILYTATAFYSVPYSLDKDGNPVQRGIEVKVTVPADGATVKFMDKDGNYTLDTCPTYCNVGQYTVKFQITANNYTTVTGEASFEIVKATPDLTLPTPNDREYDGEEEDLLDYPGETTGGTLLYYVGDTEPTDEKDWSETPPTGKDAGTYTVWFKVKGDDNYNDLPAQSIDVTISKGQLSDVKVEQKEEPELIYNGKEQEPELEISGKAGDDSELSFTFSKNETGPWSEDVPTFKHAGTYKVWYKASATNYEDVIGFFYVTILPKPVTATVVADDKDYDGTTKATITVSVETEVPYEPDDEQDMMFEGVSRLLNALSLDGGANDEKLVIAGVIGQFEDADKGKNKTVNVDDAQAQISADPDTPEVLVSDYDVTIPDTTQADIRARSLADPDDPDQPADDVTIQPIPDQEYTGEEIEPGVTIIIQLPDGPVQLVEGRDYKLTYKDNIEVGTATVIIEGIGNFEGTLNTTFNIVSTAKPQPPQKPVPPHTADESHPVLWAALTLCMGLGATVILRKKKEN